MKHLGIHIGLTERGYNPEAWPYIEGSNKVWDAEGGPAGRLLIKASRDLLIATGRGRSAPAYHLHFLTKLSHWDAHAKEVAGHIAQVLEVLEPMRKEAYFAPPFGLHDIVGGATALGRLGVGGAMGLGGGLGALYWMLSRHSNQDSADIESMQNQADYYRQLSKEVEDSMRRKYRYERHDQNGQPVTDTSAVTA